MSNININENVIMNGHLENSKDKGNTTNNNNSQDNKELKDSKESNDISQIISQSPFKMAKTFGINFVKYFSLRSIYSVLKLFLSKRKLILSKELLFHIFSLSNLRTSLFVAMLPLLFNTFKKLFGNNERGIFLSGMLSGFIAFYFEEKTNLVKFLVLSLMVRVLYSYLIVINQNSEYDIPYFSYEFLFFLISSTAMVYISFLYPQFTGITNLFDAYGSFTKIDQYQMWRLRNIIKII